MQGRNSFERETLAVLEGKNDHPLPPGEENLLQDITNSLTVISVVAELCLEKSGPDGPDSHLLRAVLREVEEIDGAVRALLAGRGEAEG